MSRSYHYPANVKIYGVYGSTTHHLECGHSVAAKNSAGTPKRKRCRNCFYARRQTP